MIGPTRGDGGEDEAAACGERAEFYLCLARAFLTPATEEAYRGMSHYLADDLADLGERLGYPVDGALGDLRAALSDVPDHLSLLQLYSKLFLSPPAPVHLNAGLYLDGALLGASVLAMEQHYRRHGVQRAETFHDLSDHVAVQLEFVAYLLAAGAAATRTGDAAEAARLDAEAREFLLAFVAAWLPGLCADLERAVREQGVGALYLHLARILGTAVGCDTADEPRAEPAPVTSTVAPIAARGPTPARLQEVARALAAHGQSTEYMGTPLAVRDEALGFTRLTPPDLKRSRSG